MKVRKPRRVRESPSTREMEEEDTRSSEDTSRVEQDPGSRMPGEREDDALRPFHRSHQGDYDGSGQQSCKCNYVDFSK